ncbi:MAG: NfeD family protein [Methyloligellaceae bacterium]
MFPFSNDEIRRVWLRKRAPRSSWAIAAAILLLVAGNFSNADPQKGGYLLTLTGPIGPAASDYIGKGILTAREEGAELVVLQIDTPGGLDTSMRTIIRDILSSSVPVVTFVAPSGARAASAGTYILYASHVAAMAPGTNLGAATPVQIGGGFRPFPTPQSPDPTNGNKKDQTKKEDESKPAAKKPTLSDKAVNDAVAYIRSLAQLRGRNVEWAEKAVREAASLPAADALQENVIDLLADDVKDLLAKLNGREVKVLGQARRLRTAGLALRHIEPDWRSKLLGIITNPNIAYILMLIGIYGLILEFYSPGLVGPGVIGAISLVLAFYAFHILPINYAGFALIIFGVALMIAEAFAPSFGILGIGGAAAFAIGSIMLIDVDVPGYRISRLLIGSIGFISAGGFLLVLILLARARQRPVVSGPEEMIGLAGEVIDWHAGEGRVRIHGELWRAKASGEIPPGDEVRVDSIDGLTLVVTPVN